MTWLAKLNKPCLHFLVLGLVFYQLQLAMFAEPKSVIGPLAEARLEALQQQWLSRAGQLPSAKQTIRMIADELDRDVLFHRALELGLHLHDNVVYQQLLRDMRFLNMAEGKTNAELFEQALDMRLHLNDEAIKRRLIKLMQQRLMLAVSLVMPTKAQILAEFSARKDSLRLPSRYSIEHIFFSRDRETKSVIAAIQQQRLDAKTARHLSSPFMSGYEFKRQTPSELAKYFGAQFVLMLEKSEIGGGQWDGPIASTYGLHYVWVTALEPARDAQLEEVERQLRRDLESRARSQALQSATASLRADYTVRL